ncbi:uroporphyrinogen-III synthase [Sinimarinibacterium sp. NLF-5-8]|uniref:uroporphyrinogen-III synthase n=1 Tax=Sinimarinibacterium sp. NLF-5-8 TaxID=2698684 RepID=UPI00137C2382|nr:uroporphyrinogen-III synthase [Sinimarinibacterium sp. NLF-5-8]QHS10354.1 uroporphyrinogen-III synthase [Sinimarinibacterium sp. NLF-5-8]
MAGAQTLAGLRVLVTRPAAQAESLCGQLSARGAQVSRLPLQRIEFINTPALAIRLRSLRSASLWIFTSVNAVSGARALDQGAWPACAAIGEATAQALRQVAGVEALRPEAQYDSEGLLALPVLQNIQGREIVLISGQGGRGVLEPALIARGARLVRLDVYRRLPLVHAAADLGRALEGLDAIIITSGEALMQFFAQLTPAQRAQVLRVQLVVPSARVVEHARQMGFKRAPRIASPISDVGYVHALEAWWTLD